MPAQPLGQRVDHDVRTERDRLRQVRRRERGVDDQRNANGVRLLGDCLEVDDLQGGVGARLAEEGARLVIRRRRKGFGVGCVHKAHLDAKLGQDVVEHRVRAAVQGFRRDDVVASARNVDDRVEDGRRARGEAEAAERVRALEHGDALLKDVGGRVHQTGVDVAELSKGEELGRVVGGLEDKGRGAVDRHTARPCAVGAIARVQAQRVEVCILTGDLAIMDGERAHASDEASFRLRQIPRHGRIMDAPRTRKDASCSMNARSMCTGRCRFTARRCRLELQHL